MRYSQEAIKKLVEEQEASGKSVREFCAGRGLNREVFYVWRQRARKESAGFARVETGAVKRVEHELSGGVILGVSLEDLRSVLEALR